MPGHLATREPLRVDKTLRQHLGLVYHGEHRRHCADLARHEFVGAPHVRQDRDADEVEEDEERQGEGDPEGAERLLLVVSVVLVLFFIVVAALSGDEARAVDGDGGDADC